MKVSTRSKYGIKAMVDIATYSQNNKCVCIKNIAKRQGISENYLEQIMICLKKDNYIKSIRGAQGGYTLNKKPEEITVGDLLRTLENSLSLVECVEKTTDFKKCGDADCSSCTVKYAWSFISEKLSEAADSITLRDLIML